MTAEELILRRCAFWENLAGFPEIQNKKSATISVNRNNRFDVNSLKKLMEWAKTGGIA